MTAYIEKVKGFLKGPGGIILILALFRLLLHLFTAGNYDYFIDELYTVSCGRHLDWGFVDIPSMAPVIAAFSMAVFGKSMIAIRVIPAIAGAVLVVFSSLLAVKMGGWQIRGVHNRISSDICAGLAGNEFLFCL